METESSVVEIAFLAQPRLDFPKRAWIEVFRNEVNSGLGSAALSVPAGPA